MRPLRTRSSDTDSATLCALSSPVTGRNGLQIGRHAFGIPGLPDEESDELLNRLLRLAADDASRVYYHQWEVGDLVVRTLATSAACSVGLGAAAEGFCHTLLVGADLGQPTYAASSVPLSS